MSLLYLIRHPHTRINLDVPAPEWGLSDEGQAQTAALLEAPFWPHVATVYPSREPKSITTAKEASLAYEIPAIPRSTLGEVNRSAYVAPDEAAYQAAVAAFFENPTQSPHGWEPAIAALQRFKNGIAQINSWHGADESCAVVAHGLVLTLYIADLQGIRPTLQMWRAIGFAAVAAVDRTTMTLASDFLTAPYEGLPLPS